MVEVSLSRFYIEENAISNNSSLTHDELLCIVQLLSLESSYQHLKLFLRLHILLAKLTFRFLSFPLVFFFYEPQEIRRPSKRAQVLEVQDFREL